MPIVLQPSWVGRRVSVRRVVDRAPDGRLLLADVVGELAGLDEQTAVIDSRKGLVEVPVAFVTVARLVPPSTGDELALQSVGARGLRAADTHQLGGWLLRADGGFAHRVNSVLPLRQLGVPFEEALRAAHDWYAARGLPLQFQLPVEARRLLDAELAERGWLPDAPTHVMAGHVRLSAGQPDDPRIDLDAEPDEQWLSLYRGGAGAGSRGRALLTRHDTVAFAAMRVDGRTVAVGRGAVDDGWLGVMAVEVEPAYRRQRLARAVTSALHRWGAAHGAERSYLQVSFDNSAAIALYERLGYWRHHDYHYRIEPAPKGS